MTDMDVALFIGLQASGKSTFYADRFAGTHALVSRDRFRNNAHPSRRQAQLLAEALAAGRSVVVDNTSPTVADRAAIIVIARQYGARVVGYRFESSVAESRERNRGRVGPARVPDVAIYATAKRFEPPTYAEGFDRLYAVRIAGDGAFAVHAIPREEAGEAP